MAISQDHENSNPSRPMNVGQIVKKAQSFDYNKAIPLRYWLRTAGTLIKEAEIYEHEGNDQQTYLLLFRHAQLVLGNLTQHPDALREENRNAIAQAEKDVGRNLPKLEYLKPRINRKYERYEQLIKDKQVRKSNEPLNRLPLSTSGQTLRTEGYHQRLPSDPAIAGNTETLIAGDNKELAVQLAHEEIRRRAKARRSTSKAGIPDEVEQERRGAGLWGNWEEAFAKDSQLRDRESLSWQMQNVRSKFNGVGHNEEEIDRRKSSVEDHRSAYKYPAVPEKSTDQRSNPQNLVLISSPILGSSTNTSNFTFPPKPPPKDMRLSPQTSVPPRPAKTFLVDEGYSSRSETPSPPPPSLPSSLPPVPDKRTTRFTFQPSAYLENGSPLRTVFLPPDLRHRFVELARSNTLRNLETCGILCGTLISNALFISKLVIPDQNSTSDTCEMINESDLFDYVDGEDQLVLGWIHTHPTQTCFMSSRDLHTHCGYQLMMPESIAIVCAPSKAEDWGAFRLTDPPGMGAIKRCTQQGIFHPHVEQNLYTGALRPGHVFEAKGLEFEVVDLRPKA